MTQAPFPEPIRPEEPSVFGDSDWTSHPRAIRRLPNGDLVTARRYQDALARLEAEQAPFLENRF
jgi:hypothetical protein